MSNVPVKKFRSGAVSASVWANENEGKTYYSCSLTRTYMDKKTEQLKNTSDFREADLPVVADLAKRVADFIHGLKDEAEAERYAGAEDDE